MLHRMQRNRRVAAPPPPATTDDATRAVALVQNARQLLKPFADLPERKYMRVINYVSEKLGGPEAAGALLRVARIHLDAGGSRISQAEFSRLISECNELFELLQNILLNWTVILSLFLTIYVTLAVMHSGSVAYEHGTAQTHWAFGDGSADAGAWSDLATFAWPDDDEAQQGLRRGLYVAECAFVAFGCCLCMCGLMNVLVIYSFFSTALPDNLTKLEFLFEEPNRKGMASLWASFDMSLSTLGLSVAFQTARSSAIMSLCMFGCTLLVHLYIAGKVVIGGPATSGHLSMQRQARLILSGAAEEAPPVSAHAADKDKVEAVEPAT